MSITFPDLPYAKDALEPHISSRTLEFHHGKHHKTYVDTANKMLAGTDMENMEVEQIIKKVSGDASKMGIFNNAAQAWNHSFYWKCMKPNGGGTPSGDIGQKINADFDGFEKFCEEFKNAGLTQFGSGWAWLVMDGGKLKITKTPNAETPLTTGAKPLLVADVWEHAYYLDYQNLRANYLTTFMEKLINWDFVNSRLK